MARTNDEIAPAESQLWNPAPDQLKGCGTVYEIIDWIRTVRHLPYYTINVEVVPSQRQPQPLEELVASGLEELTLGGNNSNSNGRKELAHLLDALQAPNLKKAAICRPGKSTNALEEAVYKFLTRTGASEILTAVSLSLMCCHKAGLEAYLRSPAAGHLISLRLHTNSDVKTIVLYSLVHGNRLSNLTELVLRNVKNIHPKKDLLRTLRIRHAEGYRRLRHVKYTSVTGVPVAVARGGRALGIEITAFSRNYVTKK